MVTCIINAMEGCDMAIADIPSGFLHTVMVLGNYTVRIRLCGVLADLLVNIYPAKFSEKLSCKVERR